MRILVICLMHLFLFVSVGTSFSDELKIDWEVKHRFRFFNTSPSAAPSIFFKMQEAAWNEVIKSNNFDKLNAVSLMEAKLNNKVWLQRFYKNNRVKLGITKNEIDKGGHARWGWSKHAVRDNKTCWDPRQQWHSSCNTDAIGDPLRTDYVKPQRHTILAKITGIKNPHKYKCTWSADITSVFSLEKSVSKKITKRCDKKIHLRIPFEPNKNGISESTLIKVRVKGSQKSNRNAKTRISVRDLLVVGMGDSYSSGEGNPDVPVIMAKFPSNTDNHGIIHNADSLDPLAYIKNRTQLIKARNLQYYKLPKKKFVSGVVAHRQNKNNPAKWLDRNCHRSMYSYHTRAALQLALETNKQTAVTFLGYACSGAKLTKGILLEYEGVEKVNSKYLSKSGKKRRPMPQLARLIEELCATPVSLNTNKWKKITKIKTGKDGRKKWVKLPKCGEGKPKDYSRPIDVLIFSIGGNDVGFVPIIVNSIFSDFHKFDKNGNKIKIKKNLSLLAKLGDALIGHDTKFAQDYMLKQLPFRFESFIIALKEAGIPIKSHITSTESGKKTKQNIYLTAFPSIERNQNGKICAYAKKSDTSARKLAANREIIAGMTMLPTKSWFSFSGNKMLKASTFSEELISAMKIATTKHKLVFIDKHRKEFETHGVCAQASNAGSKNHERMLAPFYIKTSVKKKVGWYKGYSAYNYDCYRSRQRWIRSFDDAFFCANTIRGKYPSKRGRNEEHIAMMSLGGPLHPTAEGHSHIADAVINSLRKLKIIRERLTSKTR